jgi:hypothetical protein
VWPVVKEAALGTVNLVVAGSAGVIAAALQSIPVAALGGAAYAALIAWDAMNPEFQAKVRRKAQNDAGPDFVPMLQSGDEKVKHFAGALLEARSSRQSAFDGAPEAAKSFLDGSLSQVPQLEAHAHLLLEQLAALRRYLAETSTSGLKKELLELERRSSSSTDAEAREQLKSAAEAKLSEVRTVEDLERTGERIEAHLTNIVTVLEGVPAKLHHMRALDESNRAAYSQDVSGDLQRLDAELSAFEETLKPIRMGARA